MKPEICKFLTGPFTVNRVGMTGCEIRNGEGEVVAWTVDRATAHVIAGLLNAYFESVKLKERPPT